MMAGKSKGRSRRQQHVQTPFNAKRQRGFPTAQSEYPKPSQDTPHLTMQQEARNTGRHAISSSSLRHHQVSFVSAGNMRRDDNDDQDDSALETVNQSLKELNTTSSKLEPAQEGDPESLTLPGHSSSEVNMSEARSPLGHQSQASENGPQATQNDVFFIDLIGNKPSNGTGQTKAEIRPCSPTPTDSSEDEVVFVGRNKSKSRQFPPNESAYSETPPTQYMAGINCRIQDSKHQNSENPEIDEARTLAENTLPNLPDGEDLGMGEASEININFGSKSRRKRRRGRRARQRRQETNDEDLLLADYIANMQNEESSEDQSGDALMPAQTVSKTNEVKCKMPVAVPQEEVPGGYVVQRSLSWSSNDFDDLGDLSTSDDVPAEVGRIFSRRRRGVEVQYLVTGEDQVPDEARWVLKEHLIMTGAGEQIKAFDEKEKEKERFRSGFSSEGSDSSSTDHELNEDLDEAEDEDFPSAPNHEKMSDEQFARILDRQEKFGLAAEDMDWGQEFGDFDSDGCPDPDFQLGRSSGKKKGNNKAQFPSASAFADALDQDPYRGFDIMDYDRPSLRTKPKRGRRALDHGLSDSDMEWELQEAWENDRTKKKVKKREREELRALGLLGKQGKMNTGGKYSDPMTTDDIKYKIKAFLLSPSESLSLPPMDKKDRKLVHDLADAVSLKSQSRGSGMSRFPMLYKKARTPSFDKNSIKDVDRIFSSGRFMRRTGGRKGFGGGTGKPVKPQRSGASAAASYMDGDVVGASAPEIGVENRGRAMLEKMGWSTGTALGATDNKGILKPLSQVVKNTKAGLG